MPDCLQPKDDVALSAFRTLPNTVIIITELKYCYYNYHSYSLIVGILVAIMINSDKVYIYYFILDKHIVK